MFMADLGQMQDWARGLMASRPPDFIIGANYLRRWWAIPRNPFCNVYLHEFTGSDDDRALHDHPWASTSVILQGAYWEHTPEGRFLRDEGDVVSRAAEALHRVELVHGGTVVTLFMTGPKVRDWGFACPQGWVPWQDFVHPDDPGQRGVGCGEAGYPEVAL